MSTESSSALLHLLRLVSPALPVGAYVYSQGLEAAVEQGWVCDESSAEQWLQGLLSYGIGHLDAPAFLRLYRAWQNDDSVSVKYWNQFLLASRETSELLLEDTQMGAALIRLLKDLDIDAAQDLFLDPAFQNSLCFPTTFALAARYWRIEPELALQGLLWSWLENQVAAAIKLIPLGQTQGQRLLIKLSPVLQRVVAAAKTLPDSKIGWSLPRATIASMYHEKQYSRLFRS